MLAENLGGFKIILVCECTVTIRKGEGGAPYKVVTHGVREGVTSN